MWQWVLHRRENLILSFWEWGIEIISSNKFRKNNLEKTRLE